MNKCTASYRRQISIWLYVLVGCFSVRCSHPYAQGEVLYEYHCARCHGSEGQGFEELYPAIDHSVYINENRPELACIIVYGSTYLNKHSGVHPDTPMPDNKQLSPVEVLNIANYLSYKIGSNKPQKIDNIMKALEECDP